MKIVLNGETREVPGGVTVAEIVSMLDDRDGRGIAVALDDEVVSRSRWDTTLVPDGSRVEVVRAVQGG